MCRQFFATASFDGSVRVWDCHKLAGRAVVNRSRQVGCLHSALSPSLPAACTTAHSTWRGGVTAQAYVRQGGRITSMVACERSRSIAAASDNGTLHLYRVEHESRVRRAAIPLPPSTRAPS